jgi:hypothetical protein
MASRGMTNLDDGYTKIRKAAKEIGHEKHFEINNIVLSKFVHPTAAFILRTDKPDTDEQLRTVFFGHGCLHFYTIFNVVEIWLRDPKEKEAA